MRWGADQRKELEHLCRYITRPAIANERLKRNRAGQVVLQLKSAFKDGTTHIVMSPLEFMQRLAALVPRPRLHLIPSTGSGQTFYETCQVPRQIFFMWPGAFFAW